MSIQNQESQQIREPFRVGGRVAFIMGRSRLVGQIVEDRGRIGSGGRQLFRAEVPVEFEPALVLELPADALQEA